MATPKKMSVASDYVTTQGLTRYERTSIASSNPAGSGQHAPVPLSSVSFPIPPALDAFVTSFPKVSGSSASVCTIDINSISQEIVCKYELLRLEGGQFRFVQFTPGRRFYEVSYYNAELRRAIPLGHFQDPAVAALAHAIARDKQSREMCRVIPYAAQEYIESLFTRIEVTDDGNVEQVGRAFEDASTAQRNEADIDFNDLFALT